MKAMTGHKADPMEIARKILTVCDEHTPSIIVARAAIQIADTVIASRQAGEADALCFGASERSVATR